MSDSPAALSPRSNQIEGLFLPAAQAGSTWLEQSPDRSRPMRRHGLAGAQSASGIQLAIHTDLDQVADEWKAFEQVADATAFQSFHWLSKWMKHVGTRRGTRPAVVLGRDADGQLLFIFQLAIERRGLVRRLTWLGSDLCDYNAPLLGPAFGQHGSPDRFPVLWREVLNALRRDPGFAFDVIDLDKMPESVEGRRNPFTELPVVAHPSGAYVATLGDDWARYYAQKRSAPTRKKERKQLRQLGEQGEIRFIDGTDRQDIGRSLDTLFAQKSRSFARKGVEDIFARPGYRALFHDIATDPEAGDLAHVSRLDVGAETAAVSFGFRLRSRYYLILSSYDDGPLSRFGPGRTLLHELLRFAIENKFAEFDFTIGDEPYKRDWSDAEPRLFDYLSAVNLRGWPTCLKKTAFRRAKRAIKQNPRLWHAVARARALSGAIRPGPAG